MAKRVHISRRMSGHKRPPVSVVTITFQEEYLRGGRREPTCIRVEERAGWELVELRKTFSGCDKTFPWAKLSKQRGNRRILKADSASGQRPRFTYDDNEPVWRAARNHTLRR